MEVIIAIVSAGRAVKPNVSKDSKFQAVVRTGTCCKRSRAQVLEDHGT